MCGIVGYVGKAEAAPILLDGLRRLEYRGYDSAGVAIVDGDHVETRKCAGRIAGLSQLLSESPAPGHYGISHTRWATHGAVNEQNAHPLTGCDEHKLAIVLNGIVENYRELKASLEADGHVFHTETDAEVVVHLIERHYEGDLVAAFKQAYAELEGHFSIR